VVTVHEKRVFEGGEGYRAGARKPPTAQEVQDALRGLPGVTGVAELPTDDKAHSFQLMGALGGDIRPEIFQLVVQKGWLLLEMRRDSQSLEDVFKVLTKGDERKDRGRVHDDDLDELDAPAAAEEDDAEGEDEEDDAEGEGDEGDDAEGDDAEGDDADEADEADKAKDDAAAKPTKKG